MQLSTSIASTWSRRPTAKSLEDGAVDPQDLAIDADGAFVFVAHNGRLIAYWGM